MPTRPIRTGAIVDVENVSATDFGQAKIDWQNALHLKPPARATRKPTLASARGASGSFCPPYGLAAQLKSPTYSPDVQSRTPANVCFVATPRG